MGSAADDADRDRATDFVARFDAWWADPDPATLDRLVSDDVVLDQPFLPRSEGLAAARTAFTRLLAAIPDLRPTVHRWAADGDDVLLEFTLSGTLAGRPVAWENVDRFTLGPDGRAVERVNYHDPLVPLRAMLTRPGAWPDLWRSGILKRR